MLGPNRVAYPDYRGSGNETARHAEAGGPVTLMACCFEGGEAAIVRLYGTARVVGLDAWEAAGGPALGPHPELGAPRQVVVVAVQRTQTSCGYGVPVMKRERERRREDRGRRYQG